MEFVLFTGSGPCVAYFGNFNLKEIDSCDCKNRDDVLAHALGNQIETKKPIHPYPLTLSKKQ